jgi:hypothetical protein
MPGVVVGPAAQLLQPRGVRLELRAVNADSVPMVADCPVDVVEPGDNIAEARIDVGEPLLDEGDEMIIHARRHL